MLWRGFGGCRTSVPRNLQALICLDMWDVEELPAEVWSRWDRDSLTVLYFIYNLDSLTTGDRWEWFT